MLKPILALLVSLLGAWAGAAPPRLTILSYHDIADPRTAHAPGQAVSPTAFVRQLDWLKNNGFRFVGLDDVLADRSGLKPLPDKAVLLTFDDGYRSMYTQAFPVLKLFKAPAVLGLVGRWLEPTSGMVAYDGHPIPRSELLSWDEIRTMAASGLVEVASHSHGLHEGIRGNPQGNLQPAATTRAWLPASQRYETETEYGRRVLADLRRNVTLLKEKTGRAPRAMVWPYGRYNARLRAMAEKLGMTVGLTLDDGPNTAETPLWGLRRILMEPSMTLQGLREAIDARAEARVDGGRAGRIMHVDLDYIYDADPAMQEDNLGRLLERIVAVGANTVYLQAYADPDADGAADAVYFPNRHLPMRSDLFNRVAWQITTRTQVKRVYAWMPLLAWKLPKGHPAAGDRVEALAHTQDPGRLNMGYPRLSPFSPRVRQVIREVYEDLARTSTFQGLLFHDDATLTDHEDASPWGLETYRSWGLPGSVEAIRAQDDLLGRWTILKINALDAFAMELAEAVRQQHPGLLTARNLYAQVALNPRAEVWYAQALENSLATYDFTAIMAMPYMEQAPDHGAFYLGILDRLKAYPGSLDKVVMELQAVDWRTGRPIPAETLRDTLEMLWSQGVRHVGYYPDDLFKNNPDAQVLRPLFARGPGRPRD